MFVLPLSEDVQPGQFRMENTEAFTNGMDELIKDFNGNVDPGKFLALVEDGTAKNLVRL